MTAHRPRAFRLGSPDPSRPPKAAPARQEVGITPDTSLDSALEGEEAVAVAPLELPKRRRLLRLGTLLASALGGLVALALATAIWNFVAALVSENALLGYLALALAGIAALALLGLIGRELASLWRQRHIVALRERAASLRQGRDVAGATALVAELASLYARRPDTARARGVLAGLARDVIDPADRIAIAERELIAPLDAQARRLVAASAQRVSVVTALAPRAVFDVLFVAGQSLWLIRRIAETYGSRPGLIGFLALTRKVVAHIAVTGGMAVGDSLVQQVLGHGIASRLSAKLGEGLLNGLLTARVGLAAITACRPLPFVAVDEPRLKDVMGSLLQRSKNEGEA
jgi:putative membrane protein